MTFLLSMNRKEPCECARIQAAAATLRLNPRGREALWARRKRAWSTELRGMTQVWLKIVVAESFMKLLQSLSFVEVGSSLTKNAFFVNLFPVFLVEQNEDTLKRRSVEKSLSIMDYYQHDMFSHLEKDSRKLSQYNLLHKESALDGKAGDRLSVSIQTPHCFPANQIRSLTAVLQACCRFPSSILFMLNFPVKEAVQ